ncbi:MAG: HDIG domain-containing protein [Acidobacteria bacterium]|nr:HDIG domain-containing protein [Acidobacteriota bacterium]
MGSTQPKSSEGLGNTIQKRWRALRRYLKQLQTTLPERISSPPGMIITALVFTLAIVTYQGVSTTSVINNGIVSVDVVAPQDFSIIDEDATEKLREQVAEDVAPIFEYNPQTRNQVVSALNESLTEMENKYQAAIKEKFNRGLSEKELSSPEFEKFLRDFVPTIQSDTVLGKDTVLLNWLVKKQFNAALQKEFLSALDKTMSGYIYTSDSSKEASARRITFQNIQTNERGELRSRDIVNLKGAQKALADEIDNIELLSNDEKKQIAITFRNLVLPNLRYSESLTNAAKTLARQQISPIETQFRKNQIIARRGELVTPYIGRVLQKVRALQQASSYRQRLGQFIGLFILMTATVFALRKFSSRTTLRQKLGSAKSFSVICFTLAFQTLLIRLGLELCQQVAMTFDLVGSPIRYEFLIPFAASALMMTFLLDAIAAELCGLIVCFFTGLLTGGDLGLMIYATLSATAATYGVERYRHRNSITRAGTIVGLINALAIITVMLFNRQSVGIEVYVYNIIYGIGGGLLTAALVSLLLPIMESLFDILTDVKLLELSNMNLPLLRDLSIQAPGTQQHSMLVGSLAESAAEAISANALLVRVGCYYHDIGKMMAPEMFIENQGGGPNPHDKMEPKRSASVITGHVKKGILMGQESGLPKEVIDIIPQHHGTRRLHYFYNKALAQYSKTGEPVNEEHYRYPGPKPQTREAAIVMLSDCAEAASRTLDEPTPESIRTIVKKITDDIIADGQLEECEMTMREFNQVRESLIQTLCSVYHNRIKYPGFNSEDKSERSMAPPPKPINITTNNDQKMAAKAGSTTSITKRLNEEEKPANTSSISNTAKQSTKSKKN